jgi:hypothetical protein
LFKIKSKIPDFEHNSRESAPHFTGQAQRLGEKTIYGWTLNNE